MAFISYISLISWSFDGVKHGVTRMGICIEWYADEVMHSKTRRCELHIWWFLGGVGVEMHVHNEYIFAQVPANFWAYAKSSFCDYVLF